MHFNFPLLLVILTFVTGVVWALDARLWAPKRRLKVEALRSRGVTDEAALEEAAKEPSLIEMSRSFFPIILIVLVIRSFIVEPFRIPSNSMMPTLLTGDFILVNKFAYGVRLPVVHTKFIDSGAPQRGDVAVFRYPKDPRIDYIKRIVALPGDRVSYYDKILYINGVQAPQQYIENYVGVGSGSVMTGARRLLEDIGGVEHDILTKSQGGMLLGNLDVIVPEGHYFAMGDNRDRSSDSRVWGFLPEENLVGKAFFIWMNWDSQQDGIVDWSRIGSGIQ
ncbi:MAG: signal peptidase I [Chromatiales bacterium]|nr:signal peptidase I [Chromatiales bacterium]